MINNENFIQAIWGFLYQDLPTSGLDPVVAKEITEVKTHIDNCYDREKNVINFEGLLQYIRDIKNQLIHPVDTNLPQANVNTEYLIQFVEAYRDYFLLQSIDESRAWTNGKLADAVMTDLQELLKVSQPEDLQHELSKETKHINFVQLGLSLKGNSFSLWQQALKARMLFESSHRLQNIYNNKATDFSNKFNAALKIAVDDIRVESDNVEIKKLLDLYIERKLELDRFKGELTAYISAANMTINSLTNVMTKLNNNPTNIKQQQQFYKNLLQIYQEKINYHRNLLDPVVGISQQEIPRLEEVLSKSLTTYFEQNFSSMIILHNNVKVPYEELHEDKEKRSIALQNCYHEYLNLIASIDLHCDILERLQSIYDVATHVKPEVEVMDCLNSYLSDLQQYMLEVFAILSNIQSERGVIRDSWYKNMQVRPTTRDFLLAKPTSAIEKDESGFYDEPYQKNDMQARNIEAVHKLGSSLDRVAQDSTLLGQRLDNLDKQLSSDKLDIKVLSLLKKEVNSLRQNFKQLESTKQVGEVQLNFLLKTMPDEMLELEKKKWDERFSGLTSFTRQAEVLERIDEKLRELELKTTLSAEQIKAPVVEIPSPAPLIEPESEKTEYAVKIELQRLRSFLDKEARNSQEFGQDLEKLSRQLNSFNVPVQVISGLKERVAAFYQLFMQREQGIQKMQVRLADLLSKMPGKMLELEKKKLGAQFSGLASLQWQKEEFARINTRLDELALGTPSVEPFLAASSAPAQKQPMPSSTTYTGDLASQSELSSSTNQTTDEALVGLAPSQALVTDTDENMPEEITPQEETALPETSTSWTVPVIDIPPPEELVASLDVLPSPLEAVAAATELPKAHAITEKSNIASVPIIQEQIKTILLSLAGYYSETQKYSDFQKKYLATSILDLANDLQKFSNEQKITFLKENNLGELQQVTKAILSKILPKTGTVPDLERTKEGLFFFVPNDTVFEPNKDSASKELASLPKDPRSDNISWILQAVLTQQELDSIAKKAVQGEFKLVSYLNKPLWQLYQDMSVLLQQNKSSLKDLTDLFGEILSQRVARFTNLLWNIDACSSDLVNETLLKELFVKATPTPTMAKASVVIAHERKEVEEKATGAVKPAELQVPAKIEISEDVVTLAKNIISNMVEYKGRFNQAEKLGSNIILFMYEMDSIFRESSDAMVSGVSKILSDKCSAALDKLSNKKFTNIESTEPNKLFSFYSQDKYLYDFDEQEAKDQLDSSSSKRPMIITAPISRTEMINLEHFLTDEYKDETNNKIFESIKQLIPSMKHARMPLWQCYKSFCKVAKQHKAEEKDLQKLHSVFSSLITKRAFLIGNFLSSANERYNVVNARKGYKPKDIVDLIEALDKDSIEFIRGLQISRGNINKLLADGKTSRDDVMEQIEKCLQLSNQADQEFSFRSKQLSKTLMSVDEGQLLAALQANVALTKQQINELCIPMQKQLEDLQHPVASNASVSMLEPKPSEAQLAATKIPEAENKIDLILPDTTASVLEPKPLEVKSIPEVIKMPEINKINPLLRAAMAQNRAGKAGAPVPASVMPLIELPKAKGLSIDEDIQAYRDKLHSMYDTYLSGLQKRVQALNALVGNKPIDDISKDLQQIWKVTSEVKMGLGSGLENFLQDRHLNALENKEALTPLLHEINEIQNSIDSQIAIMVDIGKKCNLIAAIQIFANEQEKKYMEYLTKERQQFEQWFKTNQGQVIELQYKLLALQGMKGLIVDDCKRFLTDHNELAGEADVMKILPFQSMLERVTSAIVDFQTKMLATQEEWTLSKAQAPERVQLGDEGQRMLVAQDLTEIEKLCDDYTKSLVQMKVDVDTITREHTDVHALQDTLNILRSMLTELTKGLSNFDKEFVNGKMAISKTVNDKAELPKLFQEVDKRAGDVKLNVANQVRNIKKTIQILEQELTTKVTKPEDASVALGDEKHAMSADGRKNILQQAAETLCSDYSKSFAKVGSEIDTLVAAIPKPANIETLKAALGKLQAISTEINRDLETFNANFDKNKLYLNQSGIAKLELDPLVQELEKKAEAVRLNAADQDVKVMGFIQTLDQKLRALSTKVARSEDVSLDKELRVTAETEKTALTTKLTTHIVPPETISELPPPLPAIVSVSEPKAFKSTSKSKTALTVGAAVLAVVTAIAAPVVAVAAAIVTALGTAAVTSVYDKKKAVEKGKATKEILSDLKISPSAKAKARDALTTETSPSMFKTNVLPHDVGVIPKLEKTTVVEVSHEKLLNHKEMYLLKGRLETLHEAICRIAAESNIVVNHKKEDSFDLYTLYKDGKRLSTHEKNHFLSKVCVSLDVEKNCKIQFKATHRCELKHVETEYRQEKSKLIYNQEKMHKLEVSKEYKSSASMRPKF